MAAKNTKRYVCQNCGHTESKWTGKCTVCGEWNSFVEEELLESESKIIDIVGETKYKKLTEIEIAEENRYKTGFNEFDRVLGGGIVDDEVILLSGDPGIGKSTLLLQLASNLSEKFNVLYVSGEESAKQVGLRAKRLLPSEKSKTNVNFLSNSNIDVINQNIKTSKSNLVIIDSIQTLYDPSARGIPGGLSQVKTCSAKMTFAAKQEGFILIIIGHVNKEGDIAGPKVLEHLVDCVIQIEGHKNTDYRVLRSLKNRFGSTGEVGIMQMVETGLEDMDYAKNFLNVSDSTEEIGIAKTFVVEGSRPILLDIQALVNNTVFAYPKRVAEGVSTNRLQVISAIVESSKISALSGSDIYLRTSGGYSIKDYSYSDLAMVASLVSGYKSQPIKSNLIFIGEVSFSGKVSLPQYMNKYLSEIQRTFPESYIVTNMKHIDPKLVKKLKVQNISSIKELKEVLGIGK
jgi:DNA repair protein RadA/Sms